MLDASRYKKVLIRLVYLGCFYAYNFLEIINESFVCWTSTYPFDNIKTKIQGDSLTKPKYKGMIDCIKKTSLKLLKEHKAEGFNVLNNNFKVAGQVVNHVHYHILPRKKGDKVPPLY